MHFLQILGMVPKKNTPILIQDHGGQNGWYMIGLCWANGGAGWQRFYTNCSLLFPFILGFTWTARHPISIQYSTSIRHEHPPALTIHHQPSSTYPSLDHLKTLTSCCWRLPGHCGRGSVGPGGSECADANVANSFVAGWVLDHGWGRWGQGTMGRTHDIPWL